MPVAPKKKQTTLRRQICQEVISFRGRGGGPRTHGRWQSRIERREKKMQTTLRRKRCQDLRRGWRPWTYGGGKPKFSAEAIFNLGQRRRSSHPWAVPTLEIRHKNLYMIFARAYTHTIHRYIAPTQPGFEWVWGKSKEGDMIYGKCFYFHHAIVAQTACSASSSIFVITVL